MSVHWCTVTEGTDGRTASVCRVKWSTLLALLYPYARRLISVSQHGPTRHSVWIIQTPVSMTSCCVTWTVKRGSTNDQPQPNVYHCCFLRHVTALVKRHQQQFKIHKKDTEIQPIKMILFPDSSHLGFMKLQLFTPKLDTRQDCRLKYQNAIN